MDQADNPEQSMVPECIEVGKKLWQALDHSKGVLPLRTARGGAFTAGLAELGTEELTPDANIDSLQLGRKDATAEGQAYSPSKRRLLPKDRVPRCAQVPGVWNWGTCSSQLLEYF